MHVVCKSNDVVQFVYMLNAGTVCEYGIDCIGNILIHAVVMHAVSLIM